MEDWHSLQLRKITSDLYLQEHGMISDDYPQMWALLSDKSYQGILDVCRAITPIKNRPIGHMSLSDISFNRKRSSDRVVVENYFGRLCCLWPVLSQKWNWPETEYEEYFKLGLELTNYHLLWKPLRFDDSERFKRDRNRLTDIANMKIESRRQVLNRYQEHRPARMSLQFRNNQMEKRPSTFDILQL